MGPMVCLLNQEALGGAVGFCFLGLWWRVGLGSFLHWHSFACHLNPPV